MPRSNLPSCSRRCNTNTNQKARRQVFWVAQMAECMWKQRRVSRSERSVVQAAVELQSSDAKEGAVGQLFYGISVLEKALKEFEYPGPRAGNLQRRASFL